MTREATTASTGAAAGSQSSNAPVTTSTAGKPASLRRTRSVVAEKARLSRSAWFRDSVTLGWPVGS
ncbi:MAG: hypothetical protein ABSB76_15720 [Streptosporangiaceae bacterium]